MPSAICTARVPRISMRSSYTRIDTTAISATSHQPIGGRRRNAVIQLMSVRPLCSLFRLPYLLGDAHNLHHLAHGVDTNDVSAGQHRSEEHTSELQSRFDLVCRLLLEKKKKKKKNRKTNDKREYK